ncbi:alginate export family protein [Bombella sp. TMW 2.2559]|uniref:Alginate export family protein n=1 Tax=Bombella dulcis TaxID=2967339 RepID=A0ABT3WBA0_9PROT|nr:alginate export family protein [Bombella dulcis]MCX5616103.1 alginate export family protein [Bombella dulcis]
MKQKGPVPVLSGGGTVSPEKKRRIPWASMALMASAFLMGQKRAEAQVADRVPPAVETMPGAGVVGQPRRVTAEQNRSRKRHQGDWGAFNWGNGEFAGFGPVGVYGAAPWAEDWSSKKDPKNYTDFLDPLKAIRLNESGSIWLSLSGESRIRNWYESNPQLGTAGRRHSGRFTVRNLFGADLHLGQHWRIFGQLNNGEAAGWNYYGYNATWRRRLGGQQLFVGYERKLLGAKTGVMVGRQQFLDAPSWLVYMRETSNVPLSWNGVRGYAMWNRVRLDLYDFVATQVTRDTIMGGGFDDGTRLYGGNIGIALPPFSIGREQVHSFLDLFWMGFHYGGKSAAVALYKGSQAGTQTRQNGGFRWYGSAPSFEYELGGVYQGGRFHPGSSSTASRPVSAWAVRGVLGWRHSSSFLHPFLGVQAEAYSGGDNRRSGGTIGTFSAPFSPRNGTFDLTRTITRANIISAGPVVSIAPRPFMNIRIRVPYLWRQSMNDGVYGSSSPFSFLSGAKLRQAGRAVGLQPQGQVQFQLQQHVNWQIDGGAILLTHRMRRAGGQNGTYMLSTITLRF